MLLARVPITFYVIRTALMNSSKVGLSPRPAPLSSHPISAQPLTTSAIMDLVPVLS
jgi:hypothetical protein